MVPEDAALCRHRPAPATQQLRKDIHFEPVGFDLLDNGFTMSELQRLYECILGVRFDRRNFEKKMLQTGILEPLDDFSSDLFAEEDGTPYLPEPSSHSFGTGQEMKMMATQKRCRLLPPLPRGSQAPGGTGRRSPSLRRPQRTGRKALRAPPGKRSARSSRPRAESAS